MNDNALSRIMQAESVAVVGASANPEKWGHKVLRNIIKSGFAGALYPVNPTHSEILGLKAYPSVDSIPGPLDLLIVSVPAAQVPEVLRQGIRKGAAGAAILTAGFREAGNNELEETIRSIARKGGLRLVGPNIQGLTSTYNMMCASPAPFITAQGPIAVISQSGSVSATIAEWAQAEGLGISGMVNLGNQADLCESDFLEYFSDDERTKAIALYLEGPKEGPRFAAALKKVAVRKPVIILKPGRTSGGQKAAASHTASIAGSDRVFSYGCRQYGAARASDIEEFYDLAKALGMMREPAGRTVGVATTSGGTVTLFIDEVESLGLRISPLSAEAATELRRCDGLSGAGANIGNYIDIPGFERSKWDAALSVVAKYRYADIQALIIADPVPGVEDSIRAYAASIDTPVVVAYMGGGEAEKTGRLAMQRAGIPVYPTPERAARAIAGLVRYAEYRRRHCDG